MTELVLHVLLAVGRGATHGYAIGQDIEERTRGRFDPTTGALYQALKRLTDDGLVKQVRAPASETNEDPRRKYFALTAEGKRAIAREMKHLESIIATARERSLYSAS